MITMEKPIVTVIMPVYNVEDYVCKAIESICAQTLTDWELILVDDGSTDMSGTLCDEQAAADERITVLHQENKGAAAARNTAVEKASGKYLYFMDADDWAIPSMLYEMVSLAENYFLDAWAGKPVNNVGRDISSIGKPFPCAAEYKAIVPEDKCAQMVIAGYYIETYYTDMEYYIQKQSVPSVVYGSGTEFREHAHQLLDKNLLYTPWNKLYLASYIKDNDIRFPEVHWDDFPFNLEVIKKIERVTVTDNAYYHFMRKRSDSESEKYNPELLSRREEEHKWLLDLYDGWRSEMQQKLMDQLVAAGKNSLLLTADEQKMQPDTANDTVSASDAAEQNKQLDSDLTPAQSTSTSEQSAGQNMNKDTAVSFNFLGENPTPIPTANFPSTEAQEVISRRYLERIIGCIENITNPKCTLTDAQKMDEIKNIINKETVREALKKVKPRSAYMKLMLVPIRLKSKHLAYAEGKLISNVKSRNIKEFARLKANR